MISYQDVVEAQKRISPYLHRTPFELNPLLSSTLGCNVFIKYENQQISGSFKARGAFNKILSLPSDLRKNAYFVAASTGNHAAAFCMALRALQLQGKVYLPENVDNSKLSFIQSMQVSYELVGKSSLQTEIHCRNIAERNNFILVHPYNDPLIMAGQGTVALEMLEQLPDLQTVIAPVGGGGLISGMAIYLNDVKPAVEVVGCQPVNSPEMIESIKQGAILKEDISKPTLSDGTAGGMEQGSITFEVCQKKVDNWVLLTEDEIAFEIVNMLATHQMIIEGAAALSLACLRKNKEKYSGKNVGVVISGKRINMKKVRDLLNASAGV